MPYPYALDEWPIRYLGSKIVFKYSANTMRFIAIIVQTIVYLFQTVNLFTQ